MYYGQRRYHGEHGQYAASIDALELPAQGAAGYQWPPRIDVFARAFTASVMDEAETHIVYIRHNGRVWAETLGPVPSAPPASTWGRIKARQQPF